jgi:hypothetical protein
MHPTLIKEFNSNQIDHFKKKKPTMNFDEPLQMLLEKDLAHLEIRLQGWNINLVKGIGKRKYTQKRLIIDLRYLIP